MQPAFRVIPPTNGIPCHIAAFETAAEAVSYLRTLPVDMMEDFKVQEDVDPNSFEYHLGARVASSQANAFLEEHTGLVFPDGGFG